tara:strand:+ start:721 stop:1422 length:702 start_codon:yes stop_codon:yes gene_type:complete
MTKESVLITGSGRGLGRNLALVFAENGHDLVLNGRDESKLKRVLEEISPTRVNTSYVVGDIREIETINKLEEEAKRNNISILINNAGSPTGGTLFEELTYEEVIETITTNLISPIELMRRIYPLLQEKDGGTIININSIIGLECKELKGIGCAARWGLRGFTGSLRLEADKYGIDVISVYPSKIKTKQEYTFGFEPRDVAERIYKKHAEGFSGMLTLDGRPEEFKPKRDIEYG